MIFVWSSECYDIIVELINRNIINMHLFKKLTLTIVALSVFWSFARAQEDKLRFWYLTTKEGLSNDWVRSIAQDKFGFIWVGTDYGLNRFDGYKFHVYKYDPRDSGSIGTNSWFKIMEDSRGNLWILGRHSLYLYDRINDRLVSKPNWQREGTFSVCEDRDGLLWVSFSTGVFRFYDLDGDSVITYSSSYINEDDPSRIMRKGFSKMCVDRNNNVWIGSSEGLYKYDRKRAKFVNYRHDERKPNSLMNDDVNSIVEDSYGRIWVGTYLGLDVLVNPNEPPDKSIFVHHKPVVNKKNTILPGTILSLLEDRDHNLWIGTENGGLCKLDLKKYVLGVDSFIRYVSQEGDEASLNNNSVYSIFQDKQGNIWIGTFAGGVNVTNPVLGKFAHIKKVSGSKNSINNNIVNVFYEDGDIMWIGTEGGLNKWDRKRNIFVSYTHDPLNSKSIGANAVWAIYKDRLGNLWVGTWGGGLNRFDYATGTFERYRSSSKNLSRINNDNIFSIFEDSYGNLWLGTMGGGLILFDRAKKRFIRYDISNSGIHTNYVSAIIEVEPGILWLANETSVDVFNVKTKEFKHYFYNANDSTSLSSNKIISLFKDSKNNLWVGTDAGLNLFDKSSETFKAYTTKDGLPDNCVNSIIEDADGNLWIGTNFGLSKFVNGVRVPEKPVFRNYNYGDGLQGNGFNRRSCYRDRVGRLYFGGSNGFNMFNPREIIDNPYIPPIVITGFSVSYMPRKLGLKGLGLGSIDENTIELSYKESVFSIEYSALNYLASAKNQYAYKLEGFDKKWNYVETKRIATYTNLAPGEYVFMVKGSNNDGVWNETGTALKIIITPPFWSSWWFRGLLVLIAIGIGFVTYRRRRIMHELKEKEHMAEAIADATAKERNLLRTLIDNLPEEIHIKNRDGQIIVCNKKLLNRLGFDNEQALIGKTNYDFMEKDIADQLLVEEQEVIEKGEGIYNVESQSIFGIDLDRVVARTMVPLRNSDNNVIGIVIIERDITEKKKYEEEREALIMELQQALADVKMLSGLIPICANCKKIRDDQGYWIQLEAYIQEHSDTKFTHGLCPECAAKLYPNLRLNHKTDQNDKT